MPLQWECGVLTIGSSGKSLPLVLDFDQMKLFFAGIEIQVLPPTSLLFTKVFPRCSSWEGGYLCLFCLFWFIYYPSFLPYSYFSYIPQCFVFLAVCPLAIVTMPQPSAAAVLEKEMATHSSVLAWRIPGMEEPGGLPSMGSHSVGHG